MICASWIVRSSSGILKAAMTTTLYFEQEFQNLDVTLRLVERATPCVQPVPPQQEAVDIFVLTEGQGHLPREPRHVLVVLDDWDPLPVLVRADSLESLEHLVAFDRQASIARAGIRKNGAPNRVRVQHRARLSQAHNLEMQARLG